MKKKIIIFAIGILIIASCIFIGNEVFSSYKQGQINKQIIQALKKMAEASKEEILLSNDIYDCFPEEIKVSVLDKTYKYPIVYKNSENQQLPTNERFIELKDVVQIDSNTLKFKPINLMIEIDTPYRKYEKIVTRKNIVQDLETNMKYYKDLGKLRIVFSEGNDFMSLRDLSFNSKNDEQEKIRRIFQLNSYIYFSYTDLVLDKIHSKLENNKTSEYLIKITSNNKDIIINEETIFFDIAEFYLKKDLSVKAKFDLALDLKIGDFNSTLDLSDNENNIRSSEVLIQPIIFDENSDVCNELSVKLLSDDSKIKNTRINKSYFSELDLVYNGIGFWGDLTFINYPNVPTNYKNVTEYIIDEDLSEFTANEKNTIKQAVKLIPLEMWQDALIDSEFNVRLWLTQDQIKKEWSCYKLSKDLDYYLDEVYGLAYPYKRDDPIDQISDGNLDVIINLYTINNKLNSYNFNQNDYWTYANDSSENKIRLNNYDDAYQNRIISIKKVFLHEMGHYFDFKRYSRYKSNFYNEVYKKNNNSYYLYSKLLFDGWEKVAKEIYINDHYYTREEFFAESFAQYFLFPESLKSRSEATYNWMEDFVSNYDPLFQNEIDYYLSEKNSLILQ